MRTKAAACFLAQAPKMGMLTCGYWAEMQEEWKHSIHPAAAIDPHPIAGNQRINVTYRCYRDSFHPKYTPQCRCGVATVLRCVQRKKENRGRYMWMVSNDFLLHVYCFGYSRRVAMRLVASMSKTYPFTLETFLKRELLTGKTFSVTQA